MKIVILGTSEFDIFCSNAIIDSGSQVVAMISIPHKARPNNSADISFYAKQNDIPYHELEDINSLESLNLLRNYAPDYIFVSWPKIIKEDVLNVPKIFCIGTHPTNLPYNRGRHPLHWIIALSIPETKLSFFKMDKGIDTGDILLQVPFTISSDDTINDLNGKMNQAAYEGTKKLCKKLQSHPSYQGEKQNHKLANYWRKRTPHDVTLDLRMPANLIIRMVSSFTLPYPCATLIFREHIIKVEKAKVVNTTLKAKELKRIEPGKIISAEDNTINIKVDDEIMELVCLDPIPDELLSVKYIHPPSMYINKHNIRFN
jgi:methionyl-tRNA formyltransferase